MKLLLNQHPHELLSLQVTATLLNTPPATPLITFKFWQIDWTSKDVEPEGILISHIYEPSQSNGPSFPYSHAAVVNYKSMTLSPMSHIKEIL